MVNNEKPEELKKFEKMMHGWGFESQEALGAEKSPTTLNILLADWCGERFPNPLKAVEALRNGENLKEAAASLF